MELDKIQKKRKNNPTKCHEATTASDEDLLDRCQHSKDLGAFAELYERYRPSLLGFVRKRIGDDALAEDIVQETFLRAQEKIETAKNFYPWLFQIAVRKCIRELRARYRNATVLEADCDGDAERGSILEHIGSSKDPDILLQQEREHILQQAMDELPVWYRGVAILRHNSQKSYQEIAEILSIPKGTVRSRLAKAHGKIFETVSRYFPELVGQRSPEKRRGKVSVTPLIPMNLVPSSDSFVTMND